MNLRASLMAAAATAREYRVRASVGGPAGMDSGEWVFRESEVELAGAAAAAAGAVVAAACDAL
jgi:hypothetical protein